MAYTTAPTIGKGSQLLYEDPATPGSYLQLVEATGNGPIGTIAEFVDATPLHSDSPRQIAGEPQVQSGEFVFFDVPSNVNLAGFLALAVSHSEVKMRQIRSTGRQIDFTVRLGGRKFNEQARNEADKVTVPYTQINVEAESEV